MLIFPTNLETRPCRLEPGSPHRRPQSSSSKPSTQGVPVVQRTCLGFIILMSENSSKQGRCTGLEVGCCASGFRMLCGLLTWLEGLANNRSSECRHGRTCRLLWQNHPEENLTHKRRPQDRSFCKEIGHAIKSKLQHP